MNDLSLPVNPDSLTLQLDQKSMQELDAINARYREMKQTLKGLNTDKGKLSRRIGEAKKNNSKDEEAIGEIKKVSATIKEINAAISKLKNEVESLISNACSVEEPSSLPGHFLTKRYMATSSSPAKIKIVQVATEVAEAWNRYTDNHDNSCIYHRYEFREIIESSFGHSCFYLAAYDENDQICGILPSVQINSRVFGNYFVSVPMFNYAGPLANDEDIETALIEKACEIVTERGATHFEVRDTKARENYLQKTSKYAMVLALPDASETLWENIGAKVRAQVKRADPHKLLFKFGGEELLDDFYYVFSVNMRDLGTPVYSKSFFQNILKKPLLNPRLVVVYHETKPVSCGFLLAYKGTMEIPWASTLRSANKLNANMFMYWNILKLGIETKSKFFDFGRSSKDAGTFKFKKQWGAKPVPLYWHYWLRNGGDLPELNPDNPKYRLAIRVWQQFPLWLTRIIGPPLVKNLP